MKLCMIGTGYVGLVSGVCFSDLGNDVICVDKDLDKIQLLQNGQVPIYEPGLSELVVKNYKVIVTKSTVPVTTGDKIEKILQKKNKKNKFSVVSNPEFLREGEAIRDFIYPDRIVIGSQLLFCLDR